MSSADVGRPKGGSGPATATGSALYAMTRQIGVALGVACLVAILGTASGSSAVTAFHHAWMFMIACGLLAGAILQGIGARATETADAGAVPLDETVPAMVATTPMAAPASPPYAVAAGK